MPLSRQGWEGAGEFGRARRPVISDWVCPLPGQRRARCAHPVHGRSFSSWSGELHCEFNTAMTRTFFPLLPIALLATAPVQAQSFSMHDVVFWVGAGPDSTVLVVDFHDGADHSSYAW